MWNQCILVNPQQRQLWKSLGSYPQPRTQCKRDFKYALKCSKKKKKRWRIRAFKIRTGHTFLKRRDLKKNPVALYIVIFHNRFTWMATIFPISHTFLLYRVLHTPLPRIGFYVSSFDRHNCDWLHKCCCVTSEATSETWGSFGLADWITCAGVLSCLPC